MLLESEELRWYDFSHVVTQEVAYGSLPGATRAALHGRIGRFLEERAGEEVERQLDVLAHHFWLGDDEERKRGVSPPGRRGRAGAVRERRRDHYYRRVLPLLDCAERAEVLLKLGRTLELAGGWDEARRRSRRRSSSPRSAGRARRGQAETALGELPASREYEEAAAVRRAARELAAAGDPGGVGQVLHFAGTLAAQQGGYELAR